MRGIPVCAHIGLTPQSVFAFGGYKVQGRGDKAESVAQRTLKHMMGRCGNRIDGMRSCGLGEKKVTGELVSPDHRYWRRRGLRRSGFGMHDMPGIFPGKPPNS